MDSKSVTFRNDTVLNQKEARVLKALEDGLPVSIGDIARVAFPGKGVSSKTKGNSWVRNSLRKLLKLKLVSSKGKRSGLYLLAKKRTTPAKPITEESQPAVSAEAE